MDWMGTLGYFIALKIRASVVEYSIDQISVVLTDIRSGNTRQGRFNVNRWSDGALKKEMRSLVTA